MTTSGKRFIKQQQDRRLISLASTANELTGWQSTVNIPKKTAENINKWKEQPQEQSFREKVNQKAAERAQKGIDKIWAWWERLWAEIQAWIATKFTKNADEVQKEAEDIAISKIEEDARAQQAMSTTEKKFSTMMGDSSKTPDMKYMGFSPSPFQIGMPNLAKDTVFVTNWKSTASKPIIKTIDYDSVLWEAYDTITYAAAQEWNIMSVEDLDELFPEYKSIPYEQKQLFINECLYDVQEWKRRDLQEFADFFGSMSMKDAYTNQQDATIEYLTDPEVLQYSLWWFVSWELQLEWRTPEEIQKFIDAAYTIKWYADAINEQWYNITDAAGWTIVKSFADDYDDLKAAIKTFNDFNLTTTEALQINNEYEKNLRIQNQLINDIVYGSETAYQNAIQQFKDQYLQNFHKEYINSFIREVATDYQYKMQPDSPTPWHADRDELLMWLYQDYYEVNGKYYDKNWNEIMHSEGRDWYLNRVASGLIDLAWQVETMWYDTVMANRAWQESDDTAYNIERTLDVVWDGVNVAFGWLMNFTWWGQLFQFATTLWRAWAKLDMLFWRTMDMIGQMAVGLWDMIGFTDGWSNESVEKYKQAMEWLWIMALGKLKSSLVKSWKAEIARYLDDSAIKKAVQRYVAKVLDWIELRDEKIIRERLEEKNKAAEEAKWEETEWKKTEWEKTEAQKEETKKEETKKEEKEIEKQEDVETEWEKTTKKVVMKEWTLDDAQKSFREILDEEIQKRVEEWQNQKVVDTLFQAAAHLTDSLFKRTKTPETTVKEWEKPTTETTDGQTVQPAETAKVWEIEKTEQPAETTTETPWVEVEQTKPWTPEKTEWAVEPEEKAEKETRTMINKILDVIQKIQDNAKEMVDKLTGNTEQKKLEKEMDARDELEENMVWDDRIFTPEEFKTIVDNPFTDAIMRIVDRITSVRSDKKWKPKEIIQTEKPTKDQIQRDVLSDGLTKIQKYVDRINELRKRIGELYNQLSNEKTIRPRDFINGEEFKELLDKNGFEYVERIDDRWNPQRAIIANDGRVLKPAERNAIKYLLNMVDLITEKSRISERDAHATRQNFTSKGDRESSGDFPKAIKKELYNAWNRFLDRQGRSEMMRKLDEWFSELSENLDTLSELLWKDEELKNNAKNTILKWDDETISQMNKIFPWIDKLIDLTKKAPELVNKTVEAKLKYKDTHKLLSNRARYGWIMLASTIAWIIPWWVLARVTIWSLSFVTIEKLANAAKKKIKWQKVDRSDYEKIIEMLNVEWSEKNKLKRQMLSTYETISELSDLKTDIQMQAIMDEATGILIERQANEIRKRKAYEQAIAERERALSEQRNQESAELWDLERDVDRTNKQKPVDNALPTPKADIVDENGTVTLGRWNAISPEQATKKPNPRKPVKEVKETYADKEKIQQGYTPAEALTMQAALWADKTETHSPEAVKVADALEKTVQATAEAIEESATNNVIERGEEPTNENVAKEINKEPSDMDAFMAELNAWTPEQSHPWYDGADIKTLEEVVNNPEKYPNVDIEAAKRALEKAYRQNTEANIMQSPDQQQAQREIAWIWKAREMELEHNKKWEKQREDMTRETNRDPNALETFDEYDRIYDSLTPDKWEMALKYSKWYKGFYRADKSVTDLLLEDMWKSPSQNITYTSSSEQISTLRNPKSRKRVAQERIDKKVDPNIKKAKTDKTRDKRIDERVALDKIIEEANIQLVTLEALKTQKKDLVNQRKSLEKKREETPYPENKKKITKQIDSLETEFDRLTEEELKIFMKPRAVETEEIKEAEKIQEEKENMDQNETPQVEDAELNKEPTEIELDRYHENRKKETQQNIDDLKDTIAKREEAKKKANGNVAEWNPFDESNLEQAKKQLKDLEDNLKFSDKNEVKNETMDALEKLQKEVNSNEIDRKERELDAKTVSTVYRAKIDEWVQEAIDEWMAEEKKEMTELINSWKVDKWKKYEIVVEKPYNKFWDTSERWDIKPIEVELEDAPDTLFELAKYIEKWNKVSLKYRNGNNKNVIRSTRWRWETTDIEWFKKAKNTPTEEKEYIAQKFNERYGANENAQFWSEVTDLIEKIRESRKDWDKKATRDNLERLDYLTRDKVDEGIVEMDFFLDKRKKEYNEKPQEAPSKKTEKQEKEKAPEDMTTQELQQKIWELSRQAEQETDAMKKYQIGKERDKYKEILQKKMEDEKPKHKETESKELDGRRKKKFEEDVFE